MKEEMGCEVVLLRQELPADGFFAQQWFVELKEEQSVCEEEEEVLEEVVG